MSSLRTLMVLSSGLLSLLEAKPHVSPPTITPAPGPRHQNHRRNLHKRARWVDVCPEGSTENCHAIGVDEVLTAPEGHYIPACKDNGDCQYIGYVDPTSSISGATSYIITSDGGDPFIIPVPIVVPPEGPPPPPPIPPPEAPEDLPDPPSEPDSDDSDDTEPTTTTTDGPTGSACSLVPDTSAITTVSYSAQFNDEWLESVTSEYGSSLTWFLGNVTAKPFNYNGPQGSQAPPRSTTSTKSTARNEPTTTEPPPAPSAPITCFNSVASTTASVSYLMRRFCNGEAAYAIGGAVVNAAEPTAGFHDVPDMSEESDLNNVGVELFADRDGCEDVEFDLAESSEVCSSYIARMTSRCSDDGGAITSAGCFDWEVKGFRA